MADWQSVREASGLDPEYAYFDTAAAAPPVPEAIAAAVSYLQQTGRSGPYLPSLRSDVYARLDVVRADAARFLEAAPEELAFTRNGTESISLVARGLRWEPGDEIIVPNTEMLSNLAIWRMLEQEAGVRVVTVESDAQGMLDPEDIAAAFTDRTRLVTFVALSNATGAVQPVRQIAELASAAGILTHVNASQALGLMPLGLRSWPVDFISACTRKGLRGIEGSGVLAVRRDRIAELTPALAGWWNAGLDDETGAVVFADTARKLEAGSPNMPAVLALGAAVQVAERIGIEEIHRRVQELTRYTAARLREIPGADIYGPASDADRLGIIPFNVAGLDPQALTESLERQGIIIESGHFMATPILRAYGIERMARVSLHCFNTEHEIDRLTAAIRAETAAGAPAEPTTEKGRLA